MGDGARQETHGNLGLSSDLSLLREEVDSGGQMGHGGQVDRQRPLWNWHAGRTLRDLGHRREKSEYRYCGSRLDCAVGA